MSERVLPGVSIREVTEGLIGVPAVGAVAAKLVGTACKGSTSAQFFGPGEESKFVAEYGPSDPYQYTDELTLVRAGRLLFSSAPPGGIWVCRAQVATKTAIGTNVACADTGVVTLTAVEPGGWYNNFQFKHYPEEDAEGVDYSSITDSLRISTFKLRLPDGIKFDSTMTGVISENMFFERELEFEYFASVVNTTPTITDFYNAWLADSNYLKEYFDVAISGLTTDTISAQTDGDGWANVLTSGNTAGTNWSTDDATSPTTATISPALGELRGKEARITVIAGVDEGDSGMVALGQSHVFNASREKLEQVFIVGSANETNQDTFVTDIMAESAFAIVDERVVVVAPGIVGGNPYAGDSNPWTPSTVSTDTEIILSGGYAAALVAGIVANQAPDNTSLNKPIVGIAGLEHEFTRSNQKRLVRDNFYLLVNNNGFRTLDDRTTAGEGDPFMQLSTRMALDDIKRAIRLAGLPFIGRKNIPRIRSGLRKNLEFVLREYVRREVISFNWGLEIRSSRTQQVIGVVQVTMTIKLVFYIKFIEVDLILE